MFLQIRADTPVHLHTVVCLPHIANTKARLRDFFIFANDIKTHIQLCFCVLSGLKAIPLLPLSLPLCLSSVRGARGPQRPFLLLRDHLVRVRRQVQPQRSLPAHQRLPDRQSLGPQHGEQAPRDLPGVFQTTWNARGSIKTHKKTKMNMFSQAQLLWWNSDNEQIYSERGELISRQGGINIFFFWIHSSPRGLWSSNKMMFLQMEPYRSLKWKSVYACIPLTTPCTLRIVCSVFKQNIEVVVVQFIGSFIHQLHQLAVNIQS